jgi:hypothetical protein
LKYSEHYHDINNAIAREKQLKGWARKKKEALFQEDWEEIKKFAKSRHSILRQAQDDKTRQALRLGFDKLSLTTVLKIEHEPKPNDTTT